MKFNKGNLQNPASGDEQTLISVPADEPAACHCAIVSWAALGRNVASRSSSLVSTREDTHLDYCVHCWSPTYKKDMDIL